VTNLTDEEATLLRREQVGFVFQDFYLLPTLTAVENVTVQLSSHRAHPKPTALSLFSLASDWPTDCRIYRTNFPVAKNNGWQSLDR